MRALLRRLEEAAKARVRVDWDPYRKQLRKRLQDLFDSILDKYEQEQKGRRQPHPRLGPTEKPTWDVNEEAEGILAESKALIQPLVQQVEGAMGRIAEWASGLEVVVLPRPGMDDVFRDQISLDPAKSVGVDLGTGHYKPGFTLFFDGTLDDVLDAGDRDFFRDPAAEADYFNLVAELQHPGSTQRAAGKVITVYTARPTADRKRFERATTIPHGVFLTNDADTAEGYAHDLGGSGGRDLYMIRIDDRHLRVTLQHGRVKEYQVIGVAREVPVVSVEHLATVPGR